jgi:hypothetical protein
MCPLPTFTMQMLPNAEPPWVTPVIFHGLLNFSITSQVWLFLAAPSVASLVAIEKVFFKDDCPAKNTPSMPKLKRKIVIIYLQLTACRCFRKESEYNEKYMIPSLTFSLGYFKVIFFGHYCRLFEWQYSSQVFQLLGLL